MSAAFLVSSFALGAWIYLLGFRGMFWRARERDDHPSPDPLAWPSVVAVVPARDEAELIVQSLSSLLAQDYPGDFRVILVDDQSTDDTAKLAEGLNKDGRLTVLRGTARPPGWTGNSGPSSRASSIRANCISRIVSGSPMPNHAYEGQSSSSRRAREHDNLVMVSLMAKLRCESLAERFLIPAFVFFFQMLFPFSWVNRSDHPMAAAAAVACC